MPNAFVEPIIGSGPNAFSDIGQQRFAWAGFNRAIEGENLARAAQAQQTQNAWLAAVAQMQREDAMRQAAMNQRAAELDLSRQAERENTALMLGQEARQAARQEKQFGQDLAFRRESLAAGEEQAGKKLELMTAQHLADVENTGSIFAGRFGILSDEAQKAAAEFEDAKTKFDENKATLDRITMAKKKTEEDIATQQRLMGEVVDLNKRLRLAEARKNHTEENLKRYNLSMGGKGFIADETTGKIVHEPTGKEWSFKGAVAKALEPPPPSVFSNVDTDFQSPISDRFAPVVPTPAPAAKPRVVTGRFVRDANGKLVLLR